MTAMGNEHPIHVEPYPGRVRVSFGDSVVADTTRALTLFEASYRAVQYIPREDVDMTLLERTGHQTHCPYKGDANYYTIKTNGLSAQNAVWTYEMPYPGVAAIAGHLAFYRDRVDGIEEIAR
jgi:uncharacterized protein (DUF427 family)